MPLPNEVNGDCGLSRCDMAAGVGNIGGFKANLALPQTSNFGVLRVDHDFGDKWHFMSSYRYFKLAIATHDQVDIGGFYLATSWEFRRPYPWRHSGTVVPGGWSDHEHQLQHHQQLPL